MLTRSQTAVPLLEAVAADDRPLVTKGTSWALRQTGKRNPRLNAIAVRVAGHLTTHDHSPARWIGRDVLKELESSAVRTRLARRAAAAAR